MAKLGRPRKAETEAKAGRQQPGLMANYQGIMSLDRILKENLGFLPKEARDEIGKKVSGLKIAGQVYARAEDVEKALEQFWHDADSPLPSLETDESGKVHAPAVDCESCEKLKEARMRASNADQKLKLQETTYKAQFNTLTNQLTASGNEKSGLLKEKAALEQEKSRLSKQIDSMSKQIRELSEKAAKQSAADVRRDIGKLEEALEATVDKEKKTRGELNQANARIRELEASLSGGNRGDSSSKAKLKEQIRDLEKQSKTNAEIIQKLTREREEARNELEELKTSAGTKAVEKLVREKNEFKELFETATDEIDEKKKKIGELEENLKTVKASLKSEQGKNASLQAALELQAVLDKRPEEAACGIGGIKAGDLFYPEEVMDFIQILAARNADRLEGIQDSYKREYDLSKMVAEAVKQSGWQEKMRDKIEKAAESGDMRQYYRIGFEDADGANHEKLYYRGNSRYAVVMAVTPSDIRAALNAASVQKNMLLIAPVKAD